MLLSAFSKAPECRGALTRPLGSRCGRPLSSEALGATDFPSQSIGFKVCIEACLRLMLKNEDGWQPIFKFLWVTEVELKFKCNFPGAWYDSCCEIILYMNFFEILFSMNSFHIVQTELLFNLYKYRQWKSSHNTMQLLRCIEMHITELCDSCYFKAVLW